MLSHEFGLYLKRYHIVVDMVTPTNVKSLRVHPSTNFIVDDWIFPADDPFRKRTVKTVSLLHFTSFYFSS